MLCSPFSGGLQRITLSYGMPMVQPSFGRYVRSLVGLASQLHTKSGVQEFAIYWLLHLQMQTGHLDRVIKGEAAREVMMDTRWSVRYDV